MKDAFIANLEAIFQENMSGFLPLQKVIHQKAWDRFIELGLPNKKKAGYQYFPLSQLYQESFHLARDSEISKESFQSLIFPESRRSHIVFVNGQYVPSLSNTTGLPEQVVILPLIDALNKYGTFLQGRICRTMQEEEDPFVVLNIALVQKGLFLYVPPKTVVEDPLQCIHIISNERPSIFSPRVHGMLGAHSQIKWIYNQHCLKDFDYFSNTVLDLAIEEGAHFSRLGTLNPSRHGWHMEFLRATMKRDSQLKTMSCSLGAKSVRQDFRISLMGENASCSLKGITSLSDHKQSHVHILMDHQAPHCHSMQHFKNIVSDTSRCSFEGKIYVHPKAQKTEAYQLNNNLLLDGKAIANSKPNLEIFADDVKASHGSTVTQLDPDHLFYLKTRGLSHETAKKLLISGFALDLLKEVPILSVREQMQALLDRQYS